MARDAGITPACLIAMLKIRISQLIDGQFIPDLQSHFQNKVSQEKTILKVWGITKGTSIKYKAAREKYRQILREAR